MKNESEFEIIILGSGPAGCSAAIKLKSMGRNIAIIDSGKTHEYQSVESIDAEIKDLIKTLNLNSEPFSEFHFPVFETISLWDGEVPVSKNSLFSPYGHGWNLDKSRFNEQLREKCKSEGIPIIPDKQLNIEHLSTSNWKISCSNTLKTVFYSCGFLIDCTGRNRVLLKKLAVPVIKYDSLIAVNAVYSNIKEETMVSFIESAQNGWWYSAALSKDKRIVSFFTNAKSDSFKNIIAYDNFFRELSVTKLINTLIQSNPQAEKQKLNVRYANSEMATSLFAEDWICAGDAAAAFDPLSSQGIGTALRAGISVAFCVSDFMSNGNITAFENFTTGYKHIFREYLIQRKGYYERVAKWPKSDFWRTNSVQHSNQNQNYENKKTI